MGYGRRGFRRRGRTGRKTKAYGQSMAGKALSFATKALKSIGFIKGMINCEKRYFDTGVSVAAVNYTGAINLVSGVTAGDDVNQRSGNSILARSLYVNYDATVNLTSGGGASQILRKIIFMDCDNQGVTPTTSDVLQTVGTTNAVNSPLNVDNVKRFRILYDKKHVLNGQGTERIQVKKYIPLYKHMRFSGTGANILENAIYELNISDVNVNDPTVQSYYRLGFYDN